MPDAKPSSSRPSPARLPWLAVLVAVTLGLEAVSCWQFWVQSDLGRRLHEREHFTVNVAVAGGLLLVQQVGGGKYAVDALLKKSN